MDFPDDMTVNPTVDRQRILLSMRRELGFDAERGTDGASVLIKLWASLRDRHLTVLPDPPYPGVEPALEPAHLGIVCGPDDTFSIAARTAKERLEASKRSIDVYKRIMRPQHRRDLEAAARNWRLAEQAIDEEAQRLFVPFASYFEEPATISRKSLLATPRRDGKAASQVPLLNSLFASRPPLLRVQDLEDEAGQEPAKPLDEIFSLKLKIPAESAAAVRDLMLKSRKALQWRTLHDGPLVDLQPAGEDDCPTPLSPPLLSRARNKSGLSTSEEQGVANAIGDLLYEPFTQHMQLEAPRIPGDPEIIEPGSKLEDIHAFLDFNLEQPEDSKALVHGEMRPPPRAPSPVRLPIDLFEACEDLPLTRVHLSKEPAAASASVASLVSSLSTAQLAPLNIDDTKLRKLSVPWGDTPRTKSGYLDLKETLENTGTSLHLEPPRLPLPRPRAAAEQDDGVPTSLRQIVAFPRGSARSRAFSREDVPLRPLPGLRSLNIDLGDRWLRAADGQQVGFAGTTAELPQLGNDGSDTLDTTTAAEAMLNDAQEPESAHPYAVAAICEPLRFTSTPIGLVDEELPPATRRYSNDQVPQPPEVEEQPVDTIAEEPNAEEDESDGFKTAAASPSGAAGQQRDENGEEDELFDWQHWENDATSSSASAVPAPAVPSISHDAHHTPTSRTVARLTAAAQALDEERQRAPEQQRPWDIRRTPPSVETIFGQKLFEDDAEQLNMEMSVQDQIHSSESGSSPPMRGAGDILERESDTTTRGRVEEDEGEPEQEDGLERAIKRARLDANVAAARAQNQPIATAAAPALNPMDIFMSSRGMARAAASSSQAHQQTPVAPGARRAPVAPQPRAPQEAQANNEDHHASPVFQPPTLTAPLTASRYLVTIRGLQHHAVLSALQAPLLNIELVEVAAEDVASSTSDDETLLPHLVLPGNAEEVNDDPFVVTPAPTPSRFVLLFKLTLLPSAMQANNSAVARDLDLRRTLTSLLRSRQYRQSGGLLVLEAWNSDSGNPLPASLLSMESREAPITRARTTLNDFFAANRWAGMVQVVVARSAEEAACRIREYADGQGG